MPSPYDAPSEPPVSAAQGAAARRRGVVSWVGAVILAVAAMFALLSWLNTGVGASGDANHNTELWIVVGCCALLGLSMLGLALAALLRPRLQTEPPPAASRAAPAAADGSELDGALAALDRGRLGQVLLRMNTLSRAILDSANYAIIATTPDGVISEFNHTAEQWLGYTRAEVVGKTSFEIFCVREEMIARAKMLSTELGRNIVPRDGFVAKARLGLVDEGECTYVRRDGTRFPVMLSITSVRDADFSVLGFLGIASDLTERKRQAAEVHALRQALEHAVEGISYVDAEGRYAKVNAAYGAALGRAPDELLGQPCERDIHPDDQKSAREQYRRMLDHGKAEGPLRSLRGDGSVIHEQVTLVAAQDAEGTLLGHYRFTKDISAQIRAQDELVRAKEAAETAMRARSDFLARMSHEIRTPMNGITGMTNLVLQTSLTPEQRDYLETVRTSADGLLRIIDDILDLSKIDAGKLRLEAISFSLRDSLGNAVKGLAHRAHIKGLEILVDVPAAVPDRVVGDPQRLQQIIVNLAGNAIKFTDAGEVIIAVELTQRSVRQADLLFKVRDTGVGVPVDKQKIIFEAFTQADEGTTRKFGGTGLGLAISSQLVGLMGGRIGIESTPGAGTTFWFSLPLPLDSAWDGAAEQDERLRDVPVLVVDDHPASRRILVDLLRGAQMDPEGVAWDGALAAIRAARSRYRLALLDSGSIAAAPKEFVAELRAQLREGTPLLLMTRAASPLALLGIETTDFAASFVKPAPRSVLLETIQTVLLGRLRAGQVSQPKFVSARKLEILLAEDNAVNKKLATLVLERAGHRVVAVENGREALFALSHRSFDCVLMDVQMPEMDGLTAAKAVRALEATRGGHVPIIALTAQAMQGDRERCFGAGMDGYVVKPFDTATLLGAIEALVVSDPAAGPAVPLVQFTDSGAPGLAAEPCDREEAVRRLGGDADLLREVAALLLQEMPELVSATRQAVERGDAVAIERSAHKLKGALLTVAAKQPAAQALAIEASGRSGDLPRAAEQLAALVPTLAGLQDQLTTWCKDDVPV